MSRTYRPHSVRKTVKPIPMANIAMTVRSMMHLRFQGNAHV